MQHLPHEALLRFEINECHLDQTSEGQKLLFFAPPLLGHAIPKPINVSATTRQRLNSFQAIESFDSPVWMKKNEFAVSSGSPLPKTEQVQVHLRFRRFRDFVPGKELRSKLHSARESTSLKTTEDEVVEGQQEQIKVVKDTEE